jgi:hypothetical protein
VRGKLLRNGLLDQFEEHGKLSWKREKKQNSGIRRTQWTSIQTRNSLGIVVRVSVRSEQ